MLPQKKFREKTGSGNSGKNPDTKFQTFEVCFGNLTTKCTHLCRIFKVSFLFSLILTFWQKLFQRLYAWFFSKNHLMWMSWVIWINKSEWSQKYFFSSKGLSPVWRGVKMPKKTHVVYVWPQKSYTFSPFCSVLISCSNFFL